MTRINALGKTLILIICFIHETAHYLRKALDGKVAADFRELIPALLNVHVAPVQYFSVYVIILLTLCFNCFSMNDFSETISTDDFSKASTYAEDTEALKTRLQELKNSNKEAELFLKKYFEADNSTNAAFEPATIQKVDEAAGYIGRVFYEKGYAESTDTAFLKKQFNL